VFVDMCPCECVCVCEYDATPQKAARGIGTSFRMQGREVCGVLIVYVFNPNPCVSLSFYVSTPQSMSTPTSKWRVRLGNAKAAREAICVLRNHPPSTSRALFYERKTHAPRGAA